MPESQFPNNQDDNNNGKEVEVADLGGADGQDLDDPEVEKRKGKTKGQAEGNIPEVSLSQRVDGNIAI